ncbi:MAG: NGG1p interacting factor NIF3 [Candidatus Firestonebacteria bacterium]
MKIKDLYELIVKKGIENDPRGKEAVLKVLKRVSNDYEKLRDEEKKEFDKEKLINPYTDTRVLNGDLNLDVKRVIVGIDIEVAEVLLTDRISDKNGKIDLILGHHPLGKAFANFYEVMGMQADILCKFGVPINVAESTLSPRIKEVERKVLPLNHMRTVDAARLMDIPLMCAHTVADNFVVTYLQSLVDTKKPETLKDVINILKEIPEYAYALSNNAGPRIIVGNDSNRVGKIFVDMTGGTEGAKEVYEKISQAGVGTIIGMHFSEEHKKEMEKCHINVIVAGHISSDSLGLNLLLDEVLKAEGINIVPCSGFYRVSRTC